MSNVNPSVLLRSLIVYAVCVPLAIMVGYMLTNPLDYVSLGFLGVLAAVMIFPLLMKWHYPLLILSISLPATLFFLPGRPSFFIAMVAVSLTISILERILNRNQPFLPASAVKWPLLALLGVVYLTAKLTGGFGFRAMGSDVYGGKKYLYLIIGILSFFAITARPIPKKSANLYITLYLLGGVFSALQDLYPFLPSFMHFLYLVFPPNSYTMRVDQWELGVTRLGGIAAGAGALFYWMVARNGIRDNLLTRKIWRPALLVVAVLLIFLGGFRSGILGVLLIGSLLFYLEKLHRTGLMMAVVLAGLMGAALLVPLAPHLPFTFQRALAFLPLDISPDARMSAEDSTEWRLEIWDALLPQIPQYLLLGKGFAFTAATFTESMGNDATFRNVLDAADNPLALSSDFHSGPLSVIIPFGIWGVIAWLWFWAAGFWVIWRNYRYGDAALRHINVFFFAFFIAKCFTFLFIFGAIVDDTGAFAGIIGLSIALNHGVMRPRPLPKVNPAAGDARPAIPPMVFPSPPLLER